MKTGHAVANAAVLAQAKWTSSGIPDAVARKLQLTPVNEARKLAPNLLPLKALQIPYFDAEGRRTKFYRVRYLEAPKGFAALVEKPPRYAQPIDTLNEVYMPPILNKRRWSEVGADPSVEIIITEGELKAIAGCNSGRCTLALGGVNMWRSSKRGLALLPQLEKINWEGRPTAIAFDSDAATNPDVVKAQLRLAEILVERGAYVSILSIPATAEGAKQGLDDYLLAGDTVEKTEALWAALYAGATMLDDAGALWAMNGEVCVIQDPGFILAMRSGIKMNVRMFKELHYADRTYTERTETDNGKVKVTQAPLAPAWLRWPRRYVLPGITFKPGQPQVCAEGKYNEWRGWGVQPKKGDITPWKRLLDYMFAGYPKECEWFERWCAYPFQHPGVKMYSSVLVWGATEGTGKTLIGYTLMDIYGRRKPYENSREIKNKDLDSGDNSWAHNKQFIVGDEISSHDKRADAEYIRSIITREEIEINIKYVPKYMVPDYINYYFTSNNPDALFMNDTDRRNFVHRAPNVPLPLEFYQEYDKWRKGDGPSALFHYLLNLDLGDFNPTGHAMQTDAKRAMILDGKSDVAMWVSDLRADSTRALAPLGVRAGNGACLLTTEQLRRCYDPEGASKVSAIILGRELKRAGFSMVNGGNPVKTELGAQRLYIVGDVEKWSRASLVQCAAHFNEFFGAQSSKIGGKHTAKRGKK